MVGKHTAKGTKLFLVLHLGSAQTQTCMKQQPKEKILLGFFGFGLAAELDFKTCMDRVQAWASGTQALGWTLTVYITKLRPFKRKINSRDSGTQPVRN